ncbi:MFS transporter [Rhodobacteraceae bacterium CCMM004]|nr:MFS transporter [Rhodobacteraceae bacterium CCMM004]
MSAPGSAPSRTWPVVSALGVVMIFTWGSTIYLMAVLAVPVAEETGWGLPAVTGALSAGFLLAGLVSPAVGRLIARHGGRPVLAGGCAVIATGLATLAIAPSLPVFWVGWLILGAGMAAGLYDPAFATLGRLYGSAARGPITHLTLWGGFASTVCWPLSAAMLEAWGWRGVAAAYAVVNVAVLVPLVLVAVPRAPARPAAVPETPGAATALVGPEAGLFTLLAAMVVLHGLMVVTMSTWLFAFLQAQGMSLGEAVALGALIGPAQVGARVLEMAGRGRHHPIWTLTASTVAIAGGAILLALDLGLAGAALILFGGGNGLFSIARGALPLALFGPDRYPALMGRLARPGLIAQASAPILGAWGIALAGAAATLGAVAVLAAANLVLLVALWRAVRR